MGEESITAPFSQSLCLIDDRWCVPHVIDNCLRRNVPDSFMFHDVYKVAINKMTILSKWKNTLCRRRDNHRIVCTLFPDQLNQSMTRTTCSTVYSVSRLN